MLLDNFNNIFLKSDDRVVIGGDVIDDALETLRLEISSIWLYSRNDFLHKGIPSDTFISRLNDVTYAPEEISPDEELESRRLYTFRKIESYFTTFGHDTSGCHVIMTMLPCNPEFLASPMNVGEIVKRKIEAVKSDNPDAASISFEVIPHSHMALVGFNIPIRNATYSKYRDTLRSLVMCLKDIEIHEDEFNKHREHRKQMFEGEMPGYNNERILCLLSVGSLYYPVRNYLNFKYELDRTYVTCDLNIV